MKRMKHLLTLAIIISLTVVAFQAEAKDGKIGYVNLNRMFDEYYKTTNFDKELEVKHKSFEEKSKEMVEKIQEAQGKLAALKEEEKAELEEEIKKMKDDLLEFDRQEKTNITKDRNEKIREILLEIEKAVSTYAKKEGFSIILNDKILIYGDLTLDLTDTMIQILNENKPKE